ncbi:aminotransferase-like domain-containing protein [Methylobacterium sp. JK268]
MSWNPDLARWGRPHYRAIVEALAEDIGARRLAPGTRLPPQRALAARLGLDFTTVARGYVEAQKRGLVVSRVGQGTFVRGTPPPARAAGRPGAADFSMNLPPEPDDPALLARLQAGFAGLAEDLPGLLRYQAFGGGPEDKAAARRWLAQRGVAAPEERLLICPGAHAALNAILGVVAQAGDRLCTETLTYPGLRALAAHRSLQLVGLPADREGIDPDAFAAACTRAAPRAIYLNPVLQNPTTRTMGRARREAIVAVARRYAVAIVEDDAYGLVCPAPPPSFCELAPEITYHVSGLAKCLGAGLRLAYLVAPSARAALPLTAKLRAATVMASPITTALATRWIGDGSADALLGFIRAESRARQGIAAAILPEELLRTDPNAFHLWMTLPAGWTRSAFAAEGRAAGIAVVASDAFCLGPEPPEAVRICLGGSARRAEIAASLDRLSHALERSPALASAYI